MSDLMTDVIHDDDFAGADMKSRLAAVQEFDLNDCYVALKRPDLQQAVRTAIRGRLKRLRDTPQTIKGELKEFLDFDSDPGLKRGMVLSVYKAKLKELVGHANFKHDLRSARLVPKDHAAPGYTNPVLIIRFKPGSMWTAELHMRRYQLKKLLNKRVGGDFLKDVKIK